MNLLVVTLDTTRADFVGCYGAPPDVATPHLDALGRDGIRFANCLTSSAATPISHASIFTGLYPFQHRLRVIYARSGYRLPADVPYLPQQLRDAGYTTAAFLSSFTVSEFFGLDRAFDRFDNGLTRDPALALGEAGDGKFSWPQSAYQRRSDLTTDAAITWLGQYRGSRPFFLWVHYWDPHDYDPDVPLTCPPGDFLQRHNRLQQGPASQGAAGPERSMYAAEVSYVDQQLGRLLQALRNRNLYVETVIAVVGDHGQGLGDHGWFYHRLLYQEQLLLPFLLRVPGWPQGRTVAELVRSVDLYPTLLEALGLPATAGEGISLHGLVHGRAEQPRLAYAEALNRFDLNSRVARRRPRDGNLYCLSDGTWKLIYRPDDPADSELYQIREDPHETVNRYRSHPQQAQRLQAILDGYQAYRFEPFTTEGPGASDDDLEALRRLGYLEEAVSDER